jgi:hypothetical protein
MKLKISIQELKSKIMKKIQLPQGEMVHELFLSGNDSTGCYLHGSKTKYKHSSNKSKVNLQSTSLTFKDESLSAKNLADTLHEFQAFKIKLSGRYYQIVRIGGEEQNERSKSL